MIGHGADDNSAICVAVPYRMGTVRMIYTRMIAMRIAPPMRHPLLAGRAPQPSRRGRIADGHRAGGERVFLVTAYPLGHYSASDRLIKPSTTTAPASAFVSSIVTRTSDTFMGMMGSELSRPSLSNTMGSGYVAAGARASGAKIFAISRARTPPGDTERS